MINVMDFFIERLTILQKEQEGLMVEKLKLSSQQTSVEEERKESEEREKSKSEIDLGGVIEELDVTRFQHAFY